MIKDNTNNKVSVDHANIIWDILYAIYTMIAFFPFIHDSIICPLFNVGIRGGDGDLCGLGWLWLIFAPYIGICILIWAILTIVMLVRSIKIAKSTGSVWRILVYFILFIFGLLSSLPIIYLNSILIDLKHAQFQ